ncbi:MAG: TorF family putative porin, partial [Paracoccaceae bacterium]
VWASNVKDADGNSAALDLSGGYRAALTSGLAYDLELTQHYLDKTGADAAEITMGLNYPMSDQLSVNGEVAYDLSAKTFGETVGVDFGLTDKWTLSANVGSADPASSLNWGAGISYALDEHTSMGLQYEDTASSGPLLAIAADYKFGATGD